MIEFVLLFPMSNMRPLLHTTSFRAQSSTVAPVPSVGMTFAPRSTHEVFLAPPVSLTASPPLRVTKLYPEAVAVIPPTLSEKSPLKLQRCTRPSASEETGAENSTSFPFVSIVAPSAPTRTVTPPTVAVPDLTSPPQGASGPATAFAESCASVSTPFQMRTSS